MLQVQGPVTRKRSVAGAAAAGGGKIGAAGGSAAGASALPGRVTRCGTEVLVLCNSFSALSDTQLCCTSCRTIRYMHCACSWLHHMLDSALTMTNSRVGMAGDRAGAAAGSAPSASCGAEVGSHAWAWPSMSVSWARSCAALPWHVGILHGTCFTRPAAWLLN